MTHSIGHNSAIDFYSTETGPARKLRVVATVGRNDTGACPGHFRPGEALVSVVDMVKGRTVTSSFAAGTVAGELTQTDTGGLGADGQFGGHVILATVLTDTGTIG